MVKSRNRYQQRLDVATRLANAAAQAPLAPQLKQVLAARISIACTQAEAAGLGEEDIAAVLHEAALARAPKGGLG